MKNPLSPYILPSVCRRSHWDIFSRSGISMYSYVNYNYREHLSLSLFSSLALSTHIETAQRERERKRVSERGCAYRYVSVWERERERLTRSPPLYILSLALWTDNERPMRDEIAQHNCIILSVGRTNELQRAVTIGQGSIAIFKSKSGITTTAPKQGWICKVRGGHWWNEIRLTGREYTRQIQRNVKQQSAKKKATWRNTWLSQDFWLIMEPINLFKKLQCTWLSLHHLHLLYLLFYTVVSHAMLLPWSLCTYIFQIYCTPLLNVS